MALNIRHSIQSAPVVAVATWPNAFNTGIPPGTPLTAATQYGYGTDGQTIVGKIFDGGIDVSGDNITFRHCLFKGFGSWGILQYVDPPTNSINLRVEYCEFDGQGQVGSSAVGIGGGPNAAIIGCDIHDVTLGVQNFGPQLVYGNYIHDLRSASIDPGDLHYDGVTIFGGGGVTVENNTIQMRTPEGGTTTVFIANRFGPISNCTVRGNLLMGECSYSFYSDGTDILFQDNYLDLGQYGYYNFDGSPPGHPTLVNITQFNSGVGRVAEQVFVPYSLPAAVATWQGTLWPKLNNTGPQSGVALTAYTSPMTITTAGTTLQNRTVVGTLTVAAANVTIRNCRFSGYNTWGVLHNSGNNLKIEYCEFDGTGSSVTSAIGMRNEATTGKIVRYCDIHHSATGIQIANNVHVYGNYIHDLTVPDSGIALFSGSSPALNPATVYNNAIDMTGGGTACVNISTRTGNIANVVVRNNLLMGQPNYAIIAEEVGAFTITGVTAQGQNAGVTVQSNYVDRGQLGYFNYVGHTPVELYNIQWIHGTDTTPAAVQTWLAAT